MSQTASLRKPSAPEKALTHEQIDPDEIRTLDEVSRAAALAYMRLELEAASEERPRRHRQHSFGPLTQSREQRIDCRKRHQSLHFRCRRSGRSDVNRWVTYREGIPR